MVLLVLLLIFTMTTEASSGGKNYSSEVDYLLLLRVFVFTALVLAFLYSCYRCGQSCNSAFNAWIDARALAKREAEALEVNNARHYEDQGGDYDDDDNQDDDVEEDRDVRRRNRKQPIKRRR